jgi:hypothetical protein
MTVGAFVLLTVSVGVALGAIKCFFIQLTPHHQRDKIIA